MRVDGGWAPHTSAVGTTPVGQLLAGVTANNGEPSAQAQAGVLKRVMSTEPSAGARSAFATVGGRPATIPGLRRYDSEMDGSAPRKTTQRPSSAFAQPSSRKPGFMLQGAGHSKKGMQVHRASTVSNMRPHVFAR